VQEDSFRGWSRDLRLDKERKAFFAGHSPSGSKKLNSAKKIRIFIALRVPWRRSAEKTLKPDTRRALINAKRRCNSPGGASTGGRGLRFYPSNLIQVMLA
jgi:hypothetical protein